MRLRIAVAASLLAALVVIVIPGAATARFRHAPRHNRGLTINAFPNPVLAGDGVLIYGQLTGPGAGGQTIRLYHHVAGGPPGFSLIGTTTTDPLGNYEFTRAEGIVYTNRDWFVRGPDSSHSRTVHEHVEALVTATASTTIAYTGQRIVFTGHVTPNHAFDRVLLQEQSGSSDDWHTLRSALLGPGSDYGVAYAWKTPGERDVRVELRGDARNIRSDSDSVSITIQQQQVTGFTIKSSDPITPYGQPVMIYGVLTPGATAQPATVQLWARPATGGPFTMIASTPVGAGGSYSFTEMPAFNTIYEARTTFGARERSARLWQGVRDLVTLTPSSTTSTVGGTVTFTGTVTPDKTFHVIYLQRLGADGDWHPVEAAFVGPNSGYMLVWRFAKEGMFEFRTRLFSDEANVGAASTPVTISVSGMASLGSLPPAS